MQEKDNCLHSQGRNQSNFECKELIHQTTPFLQQSMNKIKKGELLLIKRLLKPTIQKKKKSGICGNWRKLNLNRLFDDYKISINWYFC